MTVIYVTVTCDITPYFLPKSQIKKSKNKNQNKRKENTEKEN